MIVYIPLIVAIIGLLMYALAAGKLSTAGLVTFACGLLVTLFGLASKVVGFLR